MPGCCVHWDGKMHLEKWVSVGAFPLHCSQAAVCLVTDKVCAGDRQQDGSDMVCGHTEQNGVQ